MCWEISVTTSRPRHTLFRHAPLHIYPPPPAPPTIRICMRCARKVTTQNVQCASEKQASNNTEQTHTHTERERHKQHSYTRIYTESWDFWTSKPPTARPDPPSSSVCFTLLAEARFQLRLRLGFGLGCAFKWKITFAALWCGNYMKIMANLPLTRRCDEDLSTQRFLQVYASVCVHTVLATLERKKQLKFFNENRIVFLLFFKKLFTTFWAISLSWTSLLTVKTQHLAMIVC